MNKFDNYLKTADNKQKIMIFLSFMIIVGLLLNQFTVPMHEHQNELQDNIDRLHLETSKNLSKKLKKQIANKTKEILSIKEELNLKKDEIDFIMSNIYKIKYAFLSDMSWANALDDILRYSVQKNIKIISLKSVDTVNDSTNFIKQKKSMHINGLGRYNDILSFVQYIENFDMLLKFNTMTMSLVNDGVEFDIEINAYGAGL